MTDLWALPATKIVNLIQQKKASTVEVIESNLARLAQVNTSINAVVTQMPQEALDAAKKIDASIGRGESPGCLAGVPVTIKVNADQAGHVSTNGLKLLKDNKVSDDNPVVANLRKAGAIIIGRTNTPAFSMRWFTRNTIHGHTRNPHNRAITPGGSSGGAAAAVAAGIGAIGQGSDIAGSIRYPAYACGIHGIRPSLGRVPNMNVSGPDRHVGAQITAVAGPLARTMADLRVSLQAMAARDIRDTWWAPVPLQLGDYPKQAALCVNPDGMNTVSEVESALRESAKRLEAAGWKVTEIECPPLKEASHLQILLWMSEARRTGEHVIEEENDPDASFVFDYFQRHFPATDLNGFLDLLQSRAGITRQWMQFLDQYPVLILPVSSELPFKDNDDVVSDQRFAQIVEAQLTQIGLPLMGIPGLTVSTDKVNDTPVGVQLVANRYREDILLDAGDIIEAAGAAPVPVTPDF